MRGFRRWFLLPAVALLAGGYANPVLGQTPAPAGSGHAPIVYVGVVMTNLAYLPAKVSYAGVGGLVGGLAYLATAGDPDSFWKIWRVVAGGSYFVTPAMLEGQEPVRFRGP